MTHQQKMYLSAALLAVAICATLGYLLFVLGTSNQTLAEEIIAQNLQYHALQSEQERYQIGKEQIAKLTEKSYQPAQLFSADINLVNEIAALEQLAKTNNLTMSLSVAGTISKATKVPGTASGLYSVPYSLTLKGNFGSISNFLKAMETLYFVTHVQAVTLTGNADGSVQATINAQFFLQNHEAS